MWTDAVWPEDSDSWGHPQYGNVLLAPERIFSSHLVNWVGQSVALVAGWEECHHQIFSGQLT